MQRWGEKKYEWAGTDSEDRLKKYAWYYSNSGYTTHEVGQKEANGYGLYDMSGNVWDWYSNGTPTSGQSDPRGAASGSIRVIRGGSWKLVADCAARAFRDGIYPDLRGFSLGLRVACRP